MQKQYNPYANSLDGLTIENPVQSFFNFCKERENIRLKRERGLPRPWSKDPIFQNGRFLNVFREDDRVSKSIFKFVDRLQCSLPELIRALFSLDGVIVRKLLIIFQKKFLCPLIN